MLVSFDRENFQLEGRACLVEDARPRLQLDVRIRAARLLCSQSGWGYIVEPDYGNIPRDTQPNFLRGTHEAHGRPIVSTEDRREISPPLREPASHCRIGCPGVDLYLKQKLRIVRDASLSASPNVALLPRVVALPALASPI